MLFTIERRAQRRCLSTADIYAIVYALVPESTTATADDELTEIGYYVICPEILDSALSAEAPRNGAGRPID